MRRLFTFFDSAGPILHVVYWLSLWWMGMTTLISSAFPITKTFPLELPDSLRQNLLPAVHAMALCWLALVGWAARRMEKRIGTGPQDPETRFQREEAERRGIRWMLKVSIAAAWLIPVGAGILLAFL